MRILTLTPTRASTLLDMGAGQEPATPSSARQKVNVAAYAVTSAIRSPRKIAMYAQTTLLAAQIALVIGTLQLCWGTKLVKKGSLEFTAPGREALEQLVLGIAASQTPNGQILVGLAWYAKYDQATLACMRPARWRES